MRANIIWKAVGQGRAERVEEEEEEEKVSGVCWVTVRKKV